MDIKMLKKKQREFLVAYILKEVMTEVAAKNGTDQDLNILIDFIKAKPEGIKFNVTGLGCDEDQEVWKVKVEALVPVDDFGKWIEAGDAIISKAR